MTFIFFGRVSPPLLAGEDTPPMLEVLVVVVQEVCTLTVVGVVVGYS